MVDTAHNLVVCPFCGHDNLKQNIAINYKETVICQQCDGKFHPAIKNKYSGMIFKAHASDRTDPSKCFKCKYNNGKD